MVWCVFIILPWTTKKKVTCVHGDNVTAHSVEVGTDGEWNQDLAWNSNVNAFVEPCEFVWRRMGCDLRSNFLIAVAERTLVKLPQSMIILQIFPLIVPVERNKVVRSHDSSDDRGNKQLRRRTRMLAPVSPAMASVPASCWESESYVSYIGSSSKGASWKMRPRRFWFGQADCMWPFSPQV